MDQFQTYNPETPNNRAKPWYKRYSSFYIWLLVIVVAFVLGFGLGRVNLQKSSPEQVITKTTDQLGAIFGSNPNIDNNLFKDVWDKIHSQYIDRSKVNDEQLFYGSIYGMVAALGDPHSTFMDPKVSEQFENDLKGEFSGIGAEIGRKNGVS